MATVNRLRRRAPQRGAELVEFAIVLPVLLLMLTGIIDFALLFHSYEVTTNAAREGARLAVLPGYDVNNYTVACDRVNDYIRAAGARGAFTAHVAPVPLNFGGLPGSGVQVTVDYTHDFLLLGPVVGFMNGTFSNSVTYGTSAVMRTEIQTAVPLDAPSVLCPSRAFPGV